MLAAVAWEMTALFEVARGLSVDYFDAFEYLANARILAEQGLHPIGIDYHWRRPPLVSILQALVYPSGGGFEAAAAALRAAHLLAWALSVGALVALFALLRGNGVGTAMLGVALFAANPMFVHLVPFALVDVPAMVATTVTLATWLVVRRSRSTVALLACGLMLCAAMATKYNLMLLVPTLVVFEWVDELAARRERGSLLAAAFRPRVLAVVGIGLGAWLVVQVAVRLHVDGAAGEAFSHIIASFVGEIDYVGVHLGPESDVAFAGWDDPRSEYVEEIYQTTPFALLAATLVGVFAAVRRGTPADRLHLVWLTIFSFVMSFVIVTKASRYLLPVLPSLIHLQLRGLRVAEQAFQRFVARRVARAAPARTLELAGTALVLVSVLWLPFAQAREQIAHFEDPIYRTPFVELVARELHTGVPPDAPILWRGNIYSVYPEDPVFFPHDEAFYFYHVAPHTLEFFLNRPVGSWERGRPYRRSDLVEVFAGDGAVVTHDARFHMTHLADALPPAPPPLRVDRVSRRSFVPTRRRREVLKDVEESSRQITLRRVAAGFAPPTDAASSGWHVFYRVSEDGPLLEFEEPLPEPPRRLELLRVERSEIGFRRAPASSDTGSKRGSGSSPARSRTSREREAPCRQSAVDTDTRGGQGGWQCASGRLSFRGKPGLR